MPVASARTAALYVAFRLRDNRDAPPLLASTFSKVAGVTRAEVLPGKQAVLMRVEAKALQEVEHLAKKNKCALLPRIVWSAEI